VDRGVGDEYDVESQHGGAAALPVRGLQMGGLSVRATASAQRGREMAMWSVTTSGDPRTDWLLAWWVWAMYLRQRSDGTNEPNGDG
jgi:hypothetical protein